MLGLRTPASLQQQMLRYCCPQGMASAEPASTAAAMAAKILTCIVSLRCWLEWLFDCVYVCVNVRETFFLFELLFLDDLLAPQATRRTFI